MKRGWDAHVLGKAPHKFKKAIDAVTTLKVILFVVHTM